MSLRAWIATTALATASAAFSLHSAFAEPRLVVDQLGYPSGWEAEALIVAASGARAELGGEPVRVIDEAMHEAVATGKAAPPRQDPGTGEWIQEVRLPRLGQGRYRLVQGALRSAAFSVGRAGRVRRSRSARPASAEASAGLYDELARSLLRAFYLQRCGVPLSDARTGARHAACHLGDASLAGSAGASGATRVTTGGWHDAGDFGKYVATTAVSIGRFLHAYERDPVRHGFDDLGIPESGNGVPDLLDEMQVGLDWMLTMQRSDGAVYRKVGGEKWPPHVLPEQDAQPRYVYGVTSPETAKAAAVWALAARLYRARDPLVAARYLEAARLAWSWLEAQPAEAGQVFDWRDGDDAGSGPYKSNEVDTEASLTTDRDDRLWAATELLITTAEPRWRPLVQQLAADAPVNLYEWKDASLLALSYFLWHPALARERVLARQLGQRIVARAQAPLRQVQRGGYRIANPRFVWGSNKMTAEEGVILCLAHGVAPQRKLLAAARDQLHYLLGRNSFGTSFVSGFGERAVRHPTHLFSEAAKLELPGLFVGGPNDAEQSKIAPQHRGALSWIDDARSYATNEFAIDYNASLYGLIAELERDCAR